MFKTCKKPPMSIISVSGDVCSFKALQAGIPLKSCVSQISGYQEGSGIPSPDNVRPLHAWSGANLVACGVNLWNGEYTPNTWISETSTGATAPHTGTGVTDYIPIIGGTSYYKFDTGSSRASYFDKNKNCIGGGIPSEAGVTTTPANAYYVRFTITDEKIASFGLNYPSTDTSYHAYNGNTYLFSFGEDIYSGYIDWLRGVVVGTHGIADLGSLNWNKYGTDKFYTTISDLKLPTTTPERTQGMLCSIYKSSTGYSLGDMSDKSFLKFNQNENFWIYDSDYTDATDFKTALQTANAQLVYELATPIEIQLSGIQIENLLGENNIFADCGSTSIEAFKFGR